MKRIFSLLTITFCMLSAPVASSAQDDVEDSSQYVGGKSEITFTDKTYDFGTIYEKDGSVGCEFEFRNTGEAPLVIISAVAGCGCTRPTYPNYPIQPGATGKIHVSYNPKGRVGEFNRTIKVRTNAKNGKQVINIVGVVLPGSSK